MSTQLLDLTQLKPIPPQSMHLYDHAKQKGYTLLGYVGSSKYAVEDAQGNQKVLSVTALSPSKTRKVNHDLTGAIGETAGELVITDKFNPADRGLSLEAVRTGRKTLPKEVLEVHCACGEVIYCDLTWWRNRSPRSTCGISENHQQPYSALRRTSLYNGSFRKMHDRVLNPKSDSFKSYGAKGITICDEWLHDFSAFAHWAVTEGGWEEQTPSMHLDRKDPKGNYEPSNCRFLPAKENIKLARLDHSPELTACGITAKRKEWVEGLGLCDSTLASRLHNGWSPEEAILTPKGRHRHTIRNEMWAYLREQAVAKMQEVYPKLPCGL